MTPEEREEFEKDLIAFCDRELDLLGGVRNLDVLYAGGSSPLWLEGLSQRIGEGGSLTALDEGLVRVADDALREADLTAPVHLVAGDIFEPPFEPRTFDLIYSAGLLHELDVRERAAEDALAALVAVIRPGGRIATSDFVNSVPAVQLEDEKIEAELAREVSGRELYGIGRPERLIALHESLLDDVQWRLSPPRNVRHLDRLFLADEEPADLSFLAADTRERFHRRRQALLERVRREGYTRPATLYIEGPAPGG